MSQSPEPSASLPVLPRRQRLIAASILLGAALLLSAATAYADGAHIALHATAGPYILTVFTAPTPLVTGPAELSILVQDAATGQPLPDASVSATLNTPTATFGAPPEQVAITRRTPGNPDLLLASLTFNRSGDHLLTIHAARPGQPSATVAATLHVFPDHSRRTTLLVSLVLPAAVILLFLINQYLKRAAGLRRSLGP